MLLGMQGLRDGCPLVAYNAASGAERWATTYADNIGTALAVSPDSSGIYLAGTLTSASATSRPISARTGKSCGDRCGYSTSRFNAGSGPGTVQESDPAVRYQRWSGFFHKTAVGGAYRASNASGDSATFVTPAVRRFSWLTHVGPDQGRARVVVDGRSAGSFNLYSPTAGARSIDFDRLAHRAHTVRVRVLGRKASASTGTWVAVDGFGYRLGNGLTQESSPQVRYDSWSAASARSASAGSYRVSATRGAKVAFAFTGRAVRWITATGPGYGRARVVVDGRGRTLDLYRRAQHWKVAVAFTGLGTGRHRIVVKPLGRKVAASKSASVVVDAFVVRADATATSFPRCSGPLPGPARVRRARTDARRR